MSSKTQHPRTAAPMDPRIARLRNQTLELRASVQTSHGNVKHCMRHFEESQEALSKAMPNESSSMADFAEFRKINQQLKEDGERLKAAFEELRILHMSLSMYDLELFREEVSRSAGETAYLDHLFGDATPSTVVTMKPGPAPNSDGLPELLESYFDVLGDIRLIAERLEFELPVDQAERAHIREIREDRDEVLSTTEEQFRASLMEERAELEAELAKLNKRASELYDECVSQGIDTDPAHYARHSETGSIASRPYSKVGQWLEELDEDNRVDGSANCSHAGEGEIGVHPETLETRDQNVERLSGLTLVQDEIDISFYPNEPVDVPIAGSAEAETFSSSTSESASSNLRAPEPLLAPKSSPTDSAFSRDIKVEQRYDDG